MALTDNMYGHYYENVSADLYSGYESDPENVIYEYPDTRIESFMHLHEQMQSTENPYNIPTAVCGALMGIVACVGIASNLLIAYIFRRKSMGRASIGVLLAGLAITDALLLAVSAPLFATSAIYVKQPGLRLMTALAYMTSYIYPIASALQTASVWIMTVTTLERFLAVCKPFLAISLCTRARARRTVLGVSTAAAGYNACRFWEYSPTSLQKESSVMVALPATLRENQTYILVYVHWMYFIFIFAIPFLVLSLVNAMVIVTIRRARRDRRQLTRHQRKEHATATMMIVAAFAYVACTSLAFVLNAMELWGASGGRDVQLPPQLDFSSFKGSEIGLPGIREDQLEPITKQAVDTDYVYHDSRRTTRRHSDLFYFLIDLNNLLVMVHCSVNFFIYYKFNKRFRNHVKSFFNRKSRHGAKICDGPTKANTVLSKSVYSRLINSAIVAGTRFYYGTAGTTLCTSYSSDTVQKKISFNSSGSSFV